ncbi:hypothetical protein [Kingella potus]|uniref:hypothetical protein n=1 Tax=Kingella potus TaxID=265175 RepID=UPI0011C03EBD|nr:hypothetical protein [Kingella potus]UOP00217.1 hypothetical protein LVJ84_09805 [Kingella potus]
MSPKGDARVPQTTQQTPRSQNKKPRAWLRHTPYLSGRGRLKKHRQPRIPCVGCVAKATHAFPAANVCRAATASTLRLPRRREREQTKRPSEKAKTRFQTASAAKTGA